MASVVDTITWLLFGDELKAFLGVEGTASDVLLQPLLESADRACDQYTNNPFKEKNAETGEFDGDDILFLTLPEHSGIKLGVFEWVRVYLELRFQTVGAVIPGAGLKQIKTKDLSESYGAAIATAPGGGIAAIATEYVKELWHPSRLRVWL